MPAPALRAPGSLCHTVGSPVVSFPDERSLVYTCFVFVGPPDVVTGQPFLLLSLKQIHSTTDFQEQPHVSRCAPVLLTFPRPMVHNHSVGTD